MFRKLGKAFGGGKGGGVRVKFDLQVVQVDNLPQAVRKCRVVWARSAKVQMTNIKDVRGGVAQFKQTLTQVTSVHKDKSGEYESKEYQIKVQVPQGVAGDNIMTIGKANINLARYVGDETNTQNDVLPISFKVGHSTTGYVKLVITTTHLGEMSEDGMTEVSGLTGLTSEGGDAPDQDLDGFEDSPESRGKGKGKGKQSDTAMSKPSKSSRRPQALPTTQEESESEGEDGDRGRSSSKGGGDEIQPLRPRKGGSGADFTRKASGASGGASTSKKPARPTWDDDISSVDSELDDEEDARPQGMPKEEEKKTKVKGLMGLMTKKGQEEEAPAKPAAKEPPKPKEPEPDLDVLKADLFGKKKDGAAGKAGGKASTNKAAAAPLDEDTARAALFSAPTKGAKDKGSTSKAPPPDEDDEDAARNALFAAPSKGKSKAPPPSAEIDEDAARDALFAAPAKKAGSSKAAKAAPPPQEEEDEDAARNALFSAPAKKVKGSKPKKQEPPPEDFGFDDEPAFGSSAPFEEKLTRKASSKGGRKTKADSDDDGEVLAAAASAAVVPTAIAAMRKGATSGGGDLELKQEVERLQEQLKLAQQRETKLKKQVTELEDRLADADDPSALFAQMSDMEKQHRAELAKLEREHQARVEELEAELEELQANGSTAAVGAASSSALAAREQELARLEADAKAKLAEANRMVDESMLVAVKSQQEKKALQEEIERLKSKARTSEAGSDVEEELYHLREQIESLQKENEELRQTSAGAQHEVATLLEDVHGLLEEAGMQVPATKGRGAAQLTPSISALCKAYQVKAVEVEELRASLEELKASEARAKPLELHSRIQELSAEADKLRHANAGLQDQVTQLTGRLETATSAATVASVSTRSLGGVGAGSMGSGGGSDAMRAILKQLEVEKTALEAEVNELRYQLRQVKGSSDINTQSLQAEVLRLTAENERLVATSSTSSVTAGAILDGSAVVGASAVYSNGVLSPGSASTEDVAALRSQLAEVQREKMALEARLEELKEAESVINEWEEYSNAIATERDEAKREVESLQQQVSSLQAASAGSVPAAQADAAAAAAAATATAAAVQAEAQARELQQQVDRLRTQNDDLRRSVEELQAQLEQVQELKLQLEQLRSEAFTEQPTARPAAPSSAPRSLSEGSGDWAERMEVLLQERNALAAEVPGLRAALEAARAAARAVRSRGALPSPSSQRRTAQRAINSDYDSEQDDDASDEGISRGRASSNENLRLQVSELLEERGRLQAELAAIQHQQARVPLLATNSSEPEPAGPCEQSSQDSLQVAQLQDKIKLLTEWRVGAESSLAKLQAEQHMLQEDRDVALAAAKQAQERITMLQSTQGAGPSSPDADVEQLRLQIAQLQLQLAGKGDASATIISKDTAPASSDVEVLKGQLSTAAAVVFVARRALSSCMRVVSNAEPPLVTEDVDLDVALLDLKDEALGLFNELQRQARAAPRFEAQIAAASQRVEELEEQLHELEAENHSLSMTMGGPAAASAGATGASRSSANLSYAGDDNLALSAMEQQLALAESRRAEAQAETARLAAELGQLRAELGGAGSLQPGSTLPAPARAVSASRTATDIGTAAAPMQAATSGKATRKGTKASLPDSSDEENGATSLMARRNQKKELERAQAEVAELRAKCEKLEAICEDLEERAAQERSDLEHQLSALQAEAAALRAAGGARKAEDALAGSDTAALRTKLSELESRAAHVARENTRLTGLLEDERAAREQLEDLVKRGLSDMGDDEAIEAVEAFEVKYTRLKERYKQLEAAAGEEADDLAAQLADATSEIEALKRAAAAAGPAAAATGAGLGRLSGSAAKELGQLREENETLVSQLVAKQMEFALLSEEQAMLKRDLYRAKEVNMKLASKMTKLEAQAYSGKGAAKKDDKRKTKDGDDDSGEE